MSFALKINKIGESNKTKTKTKKNKNVWKIPFTGSAPSLNATEEMEKSSTPATSAAVAVPSATEPAKEMKEIDATQPEQMAPKVEDSAEIGGYSSVAATATTTVAPNAVPDALVYKYNRYCDRIYERIGSILKQSFDPVNVRLSTSITHKSVKKTNPKKKKKRYVYETWKHCFPDEFLPNVFIRVFFNHFCVAQHCRCRPQYQ